MGYLIFIFAKGGGGANVSTPFKGTMKSVTLSRGRVRRWGSNTL